MLLRRHHPVTQDPRVLAPEEVPGPTENPTAGTSQGANADDLAPALEVLEAARAATEKARQALADAPDDESLQKALEEAEAAEQEAAQVVENVQSFGDPNGAPTNHGDLERPARGASTEKWVAYAKADPNGEPFDLSARAGLRDEIANHYLGTPED